MTGYSEAGGGKWPAFLLAAAVVAAGHNVRVTWPMGSAPKGDCLGCRGARDGAPPLGMLFRRGVLVKTHPRLLWKADI